jgi:hypothetical protein
MHTRTFKFLSVGARGPVSGFAWPIPASDGSASWVEAAGALSPCVRGAHVCRASDLPYWLHDELWETEVDGEQLEGIDCLVVRRARLLRRIEGWQRDGARSFVEACAQHAAQLLAQAPAEARALAQGYIDDARECAEANVFALGAFSAAVAVGKLAAAERAEQAYRNERTWQADWLVRCVITGS